MSEPALKKEDWLVCILFLLPFVVGAVVVQLKSRQPRDTYHCVNDCTRVFADGHRTSKDDTIFDDCLAACEADYLGGE
jgi:hypothetical protein